MNSVSLKDLWSGRLRADVAEKFGNVTAEIETMREAPPEAEHGTPHPDNNTKEKGNARSIRSLREGRRESKDRERA